MQNVKVNHVANRFFILPFKNPPGLSIRLSSVVPYCGTEDGWL
jgi:hypothetical protein